MLSYGDDHILILETKYWHLAEHQHVVEWQQPAAVGQNVRKFLSLNNLNTMLYPGWRQRHLLVDIGQ